MIRINENSFVTLEEADLYFEERIASSAWENATDKDKEKALITATKRINKLSFIGYKKDINQPLEFPRKLTQSFYCSYRMPDIPQEVKDATCEEAISLLEYINLNGEESFNDPSFNFESFKLGDVSQTNSSSGKSLNSSSAVTKTILSESANSLLQKWLKTGYNISNPIYYEAY